MPDYRHFCNFCQRPTNNDRDPDGERLCHACRQDHAKRQAAVRQRLERGEPPPPRHARQWLNWENRIADRSAWKIIGGEWRASPEDD